MKTWFISDLHLGHSRILTLCEQSRGHFASIKEHDDFLIDQWNATVGPDDVVYHLGDLCLGGPKWYVPYAERLQGKRILLMPGNHDERTLKRCWRDQLLPDRFEHLPDGFEYAIGDTVCVVTHRPLSAEARANRINVHGHSHGNGESRPGWLDISWDVFQRPLREEELIAHALYATE